MKWKRARCGLLVPILALALLLCGVLQWTVARAAFYRMYRELGRERALESLSGFATEASERFVLYYRPSDEDVVTLILDTAEGLYDGVVAQLGHRPEGRVPLILYPSRAELRQAFGWNGDQSALGVYWRGTIRLLSPNVWIAEEDEPGRNEAFARLNPIAHELTHYVLDHLTDGNYPRWFTEGLAQRVEYQATGYLWLEPESSLDRPLYTLADLERRFDDLPNQALAYRQSYLLVSYMAEEYGDDGLAALIARLRDGLPFDQAVQQSLRLSMDGIYADWLSWVEAYRAALDGT